MSILANTCLDVRINKVLSEVVETGDKSGFTDILIGHCAPARQLVSVMAEIDRDMK